MAPNGLATLNCRLEAQWHAVRAAVVAPAVSPRCLVKTINKGLLTMHIVIHSCTVNRKMEWRFLRVSLRHKAPRHGCARWPLVTSFSYRRDLHFHTVSICCIALFVPTRRSLPALLSCDSTSTKANRARTISRGVELPEAWLSSSA